MTILAITVGFLSIAAPQQTDTVLSVDPNSRLVIELARGDVVVRTWSRDEMRVVGNHSRSTSVEVRRSGSTVRLEAETWAGMATVDYELTVPSTMDVDIKGMYGSTDIDGLQGEINVFTTQGDIIVRGGEGFVSLETVNGQIELEGARGTVELNSTTGSIGVTDVVGDITAGTVSGSITLDGIASSDVRAETTTGRVFYDGTINDGGRYLLSTHSGNVIVAMPEATNATFAVTVFSGSLEAAFPITLTETRTRGRPFNFAIGDGSARVELRSFSGNIELRRR